MAAPASAYTLHATSTRPSLGSGRWCLSCLSCRYVYCIGVGLMSCLSADGAVRRPEDGIGDSPDSSPFCICLTLYITGGFGQFGFRMSSKRNDPHRQQDRNSVAPKRAHRGMVCPQTLLQPPERLRHLQARKYRHHAPPAHLHHTGARLFQRPLRQHQSPGC